MSDDRIPTRNDYKRLTIRMQRLQDDFRVLEDLFKVHVEHCARAKLQALLEEE